VDSDIVYPVFNSSRTAPVGFVTADKKGAAHAGTAAVQCMEKFSENPLTEIDTTPASFIASGKGGSAPFHVVSASGRIFILSSRRVFASIFA